jgi:hypothetical protein
VISRKAEAQAHQALDVRTREIRSIEAARDVRFGSLNAHLATRREPKLDSSDSRKNHRSGVSPKYAPLLWRFGPRVEAFYGVSRKPVERSRCCSCGPLIRDLVDKLEHDTFACEGESGGRLSALSAGYVDGRRCLLALARFIANSLACAPILSFLRMPDGSEFTRKSVPGVRLEHGARGDEPYLIGSVRSSPARKKFEKRTHTLRNSSRIHRRL